MSELAPQYLAGRGVEARHPVAHALVAIGGADDDLVLDGERRRGHRHVGGVGEAGFPHHPAGVLAGRDDPGRVVGGGDHEVAPQRGAAVALLALLSGVHAPHDAADIAGAAVDLVEHPGGVGDVEKAVLGERGRHDILVGGAAAERDGIGELEPLDVALVDAGEGREALTIIGAMVHQPVLRLLVGIDEPLRRHVRSQCGPREHAAEEQRSPDRTVASRHRVLPVELLLDTGYTGRRGRGRDRSALRAMDAANRVLSDRPAGAPNSRPFRKTRAI